MERMTIEVSRGYMATKLTGYVPNRWRRPKVGKNGNRKDAFFELSGEGGDAHFVRK
jgi:hypothetical protein